MPFFARSAPRVAGIAAAAAALAIAALSATPARAADPDIYIGAFSDGRKPVVVFLYSDSTKRGASPLDVTGVYVDPEYERIGRFDPVQACRYSHDFPARLALQHIEAAPIYGPNAEQGTIDLFALPTYMSRETARILLQRRLVQTDVEAKEYFNCAGFTWAESLDQPPEVWRQIIEQAIESGN
ncbi:MAG: hypothetical protein AAFR16_11355 [Pseudomonadota bacterium]